MLNIWLTRLKSDTSHSTHHFSHVTAQLHISVKYMNNSWTKILLHQNCHHLHQGCPNSGLWRLLFENFKSGILASYLQNVNYYWNNWNLEGESSPQKIRICQSSPRKVKNSPIWPVSKNIWASLIYTLSRAKELKGIFQSCFYCSCCIFPRKAIF